MDYRSVIAELDGFPFQYADRDVISKLNNVCLELINIDHYYLKRVANSIAPQLNYEIGATTKDGFYWYGRLIGTVDLSRVNIDELVTIAILFPYKSLENEEQRAVSIYTDVNIPNSLVKKIADNLANVILKV